MRSSAARHIISRTIQAPDGEMVELSINLNESPLSWLRARGHIPERLYQAGERLRRDWEAASMGARVTMRWDAAPIARSRGGSAPVSMSERQVSARSRLHAALDEAGPGLRDILWRVACAGEGLVAAEHALGWPTRAGKLVLTLALERVAIFYKIR
jgi:Domain of unknown function (DUF6456)